MGRKLLLGHSPGTVDGALLFALATGKLDTGDLDYEHELSDVETLNVRVLAGDLDVSAMSIHAYGRAWEDYVLLPGGIKMGEPSGPSVVAYEPLDPSDLAGRVVALPGRFTSEHLALRLFESDVTVRFVRFDEVVSYVRDGFADAGVLVPEVRYSTALADLHLVLDLGEWWRQRTGLPLPLGGYVAWRGLGGELTMRICEHLKSSIEYALSHRAEALAHLFPSAADPLGEAPAFVRASLSQRTLDPGDDGREAVKEFLQCGYRAGLIRKRPEVKFFEY
jgi:1,4-dihydroxy-6-naphthoate synthase